MTGALIAFAIVVVIPLFAATWRTSLFGLALQGALIGWLSLRSVTRLTLDSALTAVDVVVLRAAVAPVLLYLEMRGRNAPARNDVISPNLFSWAIVVGLVVVSFRTADALVPFEGDEQMLVAVAAAAFVLGLFVLAAGRGTLSQIIGVLRIENAVALFELGGPARHAVAAIHAAMSGVLLVSILFYRWYLVHVPRDSDAPSATESAVL
jgi:hydrogenase-4 component E